MLRPATPLAVMLFAAFALLLLSVLSTPLIKAIPLGSFQDYSFGVFGWCNTNGTCSGFELGYDTTSLFSTDDSATFDLPTSTRTTLSTILVLHPVAAFLTLVMLILAVTAHFHSAAHSVRYLLIVFIISIFTFLAALLAFLIDVLLFVPHMAWGSFIVLAAVILIGLSSIISCAMRRTLVSRKSRQRRIAANAEMSGENFYNRQAQSAATVTDSGATLAATPPPMPRQAALPSFGGPGDNDNSSEKKDAGRSDEQIPLTSQPQQISNRYSQQPLSRNQYGRDSPDVMMMSGAVGQRPNPSPSVQRDAYGNIMPYGNTGSPPPSDGYGGRGGQSYERLNNMSPSQRGRGGAPGYRGGRGGGPSPGPYGPQSRGGYGPAPGGRGGYGPPGRDGYGGPMPPNGRGRGGYGGRGGYPGPGPGRGRTPPPGYRYDQPAPYGGPSPGPQSGPGGYYANVSAASLNNSSMGGDGFGTYAHERAVSGDLPRAESPPPLPGMGGPIAVASPRGQAIEMDATVLRPQHPQQSSRFVEADDDIAGMVGLQQGRTAAIPEDVSEVEDNQYVPPRAAWNKGGAAVPPVHGAAELGAGDRPSTSEAYIEDVDPRFADHQTGIAVPPPQNLSHLTPGQNAAYDDMPQGSRSPAESERSTFTSISQRGINPRWNPPPPGLMPGYGGPTGGGGMVPGPAPMVSRRPVRDRNETLLNSNPDFSLSTGNRRPQGGPGAGSYGGAGGPSGMIPGSAYPAL